VWRPVRSTGLDETGRSLLDRDEFAIFNLQVRGRRQLLGKNDADSRINDVVVAISSSVSMAYGRPPFAADDVDLNHVPCGVPQCLGSLVGFEAFYVSGDVPPTGGKMLDGGGVISTDEKLGP